MVFWQDGMNECIVLDNMTVYMIIVDFYSHSWFVNTATAAIGVGNCAVSGLVHFHTGVPSMEECSVYMIGSNSRCGHVS